MIDLNNYKKIPVGKAKDYTNQEIGQFLVLYRIEQPEEYSTRDTYWIGQCKKCLNFKVLTGQALRKGKLQCSCDHDLTNKVFGRWTVQYFTGKTTKNRQRIWHCKCICGNEKDVDSWTLTSGQSQSCGCLQKEKAKELCKNRLIDLSGQRFGKLVALYPIRSNQTGKHTKWHCHCDCGNEIDIDVGNLKQGFSQSCGCTISTQEELIIKLLNQANISFQYQYHFDNLRQKIYDFFVDNNYIIEYDGAQHFGFNNYGWNTEENFKKTQESDFIKNHFCFENNIPIIRIPYIKKNNININDLKLETSDFILTPKNEQEYYKKYKTSASL